MWAAGPLNSDMYWPGTIISYKNLIIIGDEEGDVLIYSHEHKKCYTFKGAGGKGCVQIKVQNDVLYQLCGVGSSDL